MSNLSRVESITILERSQEHQQKDQGAGIRLSDEVISSITKYTGLKPEDYNIATQCFKLMTATGDVAMQRDVLMWCTSWGQIYQALKKKFVEAGQGKTQYRHGCTLQSLFDTVDTVDVHFTNENGQPETAEADLVIGADGISSTTRQLLAPETQRMYAGYTIVRGVISASVLSPDVLAMHDKASVFAFNYNSQFISYWVPSSDGPVSESNRYFNWGWYTSYSEAELEDVMTDSAGSRRAFTVPQGALKAEVADKIRARAGVELPRALAEPVERTKEPFVQVITDSTAPPNVFFSGKVVLIGDAVAGQR